MLGEGAQEGGLLPGGEQHARACLGDVRLGVPGEQSVRVGCWLPHHIFVLCKY